MCTVIALSLSLSLSCSCRKKLRCSRYMTCSKVQYNARAQITFVLLGVEEGGVGVCFRMRVVVLLVFSVLN